jgi:hypothetical protein
MAQVIERIIVFIGARDKHNVPFLARISADPLQGPTHRGTETEMRP